MEIGFFHESYQGNVSDLAKAGKNWRKIKVPGEWFMQGYKVENGKPGT